MIHEFIAGQTYTSEDLMFRHIVLHYPKCFNKITDVENTIDYTEYKCIESVNITSEPF